MFGYILKRLLLFIPTLFLVSCILFFLSKQVPDDQVNKILNVQGIDESADSWEKEYTALYKKLNLHLPEFYFSIRPSYAYDFNKQDLSIDEVQFVKSISKNKYSKDFINQLLTKIDQASPSARKKLLYSTDLDHLKGKIPALANDGLSSHLSASLNQLINDGDAYKVKWHYPTVGFNGLQNQYHQWIKNILQGDFGNSLLDLRPVTHKLWEALKWSVLIVILNLIFVLLIAFPIGMYNGVKPNSSFDKISNNLLFAVYATPKFWLATIMIIFFTTAEYGGWTNIFPSVGIWSSGDGQSFMSIISESWSKLILPLLIMVIPDAAYLSRLIRASVQEESKKEYVKTAMSKGLSLKEIAVKHILPNSLIPTVSLLMGTLPGALASSLVIEVIFNIPGIGRLLHESIISSDWPMVYPIVLVISVFSILFFLLGDILMTYLNPKIKLG